MVRVRRVYIANIGQWLTRVLTDIGGTGGTSETGNAIGGNGFFGDGGNATSGNAGNANGGKVVNIGGNIENDDSNEGGNGGTSESGSATGGDSDGFFPKKRSLA